MKKKDVAYAESKRILFVLYNKLCIFCHKNEIREKTDLIHLRITGKEKMSNVSKIVNSRFVFLWSGENRGLVNKEVLKNFRRSLKQKEEIFCIVKIFL